jgi:hypothetical protein
MLSRLDWPYGKPVSVDANDHKGTEEKKARLYEECGKKTTGD